MPPMAVTVVFDTGHHTEMDVFRSPPMGEAQARAWLDAQFMELGCEPIRASGKVLLSDKVLLLAQAADAQTRNDDWWSSYARAAQAALGKSRITVDVPAMTVVY